MGVKSISRVLYYQRLSGFSTGWPTNHRDIFLSLPNHSMAIFSFSEGVNIETLKCQECCQNKKKY